MNRSILLMLLLLPCSVAFTWKLNKDQLGSKNMAAQEKSLLSALNKQSLFSKAGSVLAKKATTLSVWLIGALSWATIMFNAINLFIIPNIGKKETFDWDDVMSDPKFKKKVEQLKMEEQKKLNRFIVKPNHNLAEKSLEILTKYWYLFLAIIILITVSTIFYAKAGNGDGGKATSDQQQQIHVLRVNHKKLAALKIRLSKRRRRRKTL